MRTGSKSSALLTELLIVVAFFLLATAVLLELFAAARGQSALAGRTEAALLETQNVADRLYAAEDPDAVLAELGFVQDAETWTRQGADFTLQVRTEREAEEAGVMLRRTVTAMDPEGEVLVQLPCSRWTGGAA